MLQKGCLLFFVALIFMSQPLFAEQMLRPKLVGGTENAVFMPDGRFFVATHKGIVEIKTQADNSPNCSVDTVQTLTVCTEVEPNFEDELWVFTGLTTDGTYLYAALVLPESNLMGLFTQPIRAALMRVLPGANGEDKIVWKELDDPVFYNGMTMLDDQTLLMTRFQSGWGAGLLSGRASDEPAGPAIDKLSISDKATFEYDISPWLDNGAKYLLPNGLQNDGDNVYFIGGSSIFRIDVLSDGSAGEPVLLYTAPGKILDDFAITGDWLAIAENGLTNSITYVHKWGARFPYKKSTGLVALSSLVVDPGIFGPQGSLVGTTVMTQGMYYYPAD